MSIHTVLSNPNVKLLIKTMDLETPTPKHTLNCSDYEYDPQGEAIIITEIEVLNPDGTLKQLADLEKVLPHLASYTVTFNLKK